MKLTIIVISSIIALVIGMVIGRISIHSETPSYIYVRPQITGCSLPNCDDCKKYLKGFYDPMFILQTFQDRKMLKDSLRGGFHGWDRKPDEKLINEIIDIEYPKIINKVKELIKEYDSRIIVKEAPIDLSIEKNKRDFDIMIQEFKAGKR